MKVIRWGGGVVLHDSAEISPHSESNLSLSLVLEDAQTLGRTCLAAVVGGRLHLVVEDVWGGGGGVEPLRQSPIPPFHSARC